MKIQNEWIVWQRSLSNYLSNIMGQNGAPLIHVIHKNIEPSYNEEDEKAYGFEQLSINCAPLSVLIYNTDVGKVYQLIHGFLQGETAETWIKPRKKKLDELVNFKYLHAHYGGEGKKYVWIKEAEVPRNTLQYNNERAMYFDKFLTNM